jgi:hypothetical protein
MATVRMKKGEKYADIFDSPEMIAGAKADGYELVTESKREVKEDAKSDETSETKTTRSKRQ